MSQLNSFDENDLKSKLEALLLVSTDNVSAATLAEVLGVATAEVTHALSELEEEYKEKNRGFQLREQATGWRFYTHPAHHDLVESYVLSWDSHKLSQAALETLAIVAYHQPVSREGVKAIRGVNSDGVISSLKEKGLIRELSARAKNQAALYGTTARFLETFGLKSLRELPNLEDFAPDEEAKQFIRERLSGRAISSTLEEAATDLDQERELLDTDDEDLSAQIEAELETAAEEDANV